MSDIQRGELSSDGVIWEYTEITENHVMWHRYLTTEEVNSFRSEYSFTVDDDAPLGEAELGFFVWNEQFHRPVVVIEVMKEPSGWSVSANRTNFTGPRPGAAGSLGGDYYREVDSVEKVNELVEEFSDELSEV